MKSSIIKYLVLFVISTELGFAFDIERRKNQYSSTPAYLLAPAPYSIPGIGKGLFLKILIEF